MSVDMRMASNGPCRGEEERAWSMLFMVLVRLVYCELFLSSILIGKSRTPHAKNNDHLYPLPWSFSHLASLLFLSL